MDMRYTVIMFIDLNAVVNAYLGFLPGVEKEAFLGQGKRIGKVPFQK
jgi:hypothetical protein